MAAKIKYSIVKTNWTQCDKVFELLIKIDYKWITNIKIQSILISICRRIDNDLSYINIDERCFNKYISYDSHISCLIKEALKDIEYPNCENKYINKFDIFANIEQKQFLSDVLNRKVKNDSLIEEYINNCGLCDESVDMIKVYPEVSTGMWGSFNFPYPEPNYYVFEVSLKIHSEFDVEIEPHLFVRVYMNEDGTAALFTTENMGNIKFNADYLLFDSELFGKSIVLRDQMKAPFVEILKTFKSSFPNCKFYMFGHNLNKNAREKILSGYIIDEEKTRKYFLY